jgi:hypothetical protein
VDSEQGDLVEQHRSGRRSNYRLDPWVIGLSLINVAILAVLIVVVLSA